MNDSVKKIQETIQERGVTQIPKGLFVFQSALWVISGIALLLLAIFLASLFIFFLKIRGVWLIPDLSPFALKDFLLSLPFLIMSILLVLTLGIWYLSQTTLLTYRYPLVFSLIGSIFLVTLGGFMVYSTPLHKNFYIKYRPVNFNQGIFSKESKTTQSFLQVLYSPVVFPRASNSIVGEIFTQEEENLSLLTDYGICAISFEDLSAGKNMPRLSKGDWVIVYGKDKNSGFQAKKIKKIDSYNIPSNQTTTNSLFVQWKMPKACNFGVQN